MKRLVIISSILVIVLLYYFFLSPYLTFDMVKRYQAVLEKFVADRYWFSVLLYLVSYMIVGAFEIPIAVLITLAGGALFGIWWGTLYSILGSTAGAILSFLGMRYLVGDSLQKKYKNRLEKFNKEFDKRGVYYLISLRFLPFIPFFLVNILAGLTEVSMRKFLISTFIGVAPSSFVYTYAGQSLANLTSPKDVLSSRILIAFLLLGLLALLPALLGRKKFRS